jgi:hypothetical protein
VPAAAVIPAPIVYIKVVAVKKLVVEFLVGTIWFYDLIEPRSSSRELYMHFSGQYREREFYFEQIRVFQAGLCLNTLAWNNGKGLSSFYWLLSLVMINRDSWGHSYLIVRGEILGFIKDGLMRKHLPRMFSLIKNES